MFSLSNAEINHAKKNQQDKPADVGRKNTCSFKLAENKIGSKIVAKLRSPLSFSSFSSGSAKHQVRFPISRFRDLNTSSGAQTLRNKTTAEKKTFFFFFDNFPFEPEKKRGRAWPI